MWCPPVPEGYEQSHGCRVSSVHVYTNTRKYMNFLRGPGGGIQVVSGPYLGWVRDRYEQGALWPPWTQPSEGSNGGGGGGGGLSGRPPIQVE